MSEEEWKNLTFDQQREIVDWLQSVVEIICKPLDKLLQWIADVVQSLAEAIELEEGT